MKKITGGIYFLYNDDELVYIGKSQNIFQRIGTHIKEGIKEFNNWDYQEIDNENERSELEGYLINVFKPKYNEKMEYNSIFCPEIYNKKNRHYGKEKEIIDCYEMIKEYNWMPIKYLDDVFGIKNIGYDLLHHGSIPQEAFYDEVIYGYTKQYAIDKNWVLENINYLLEQIKEIRKRWYSD